MMKVDIPRFIYIALFILIKLLFMIIITKIIKLKGTLNKHTKYLGIYMYYTTILYYIVYLHRKYFKLFISNHILTA